MCKVPLGKCMEWDIDEFTGERIQCNEKPVMSTTLYWCKQCNVPIYEEVALYVEKKESILQLIYDLYFQKKKYCLRFF